MKWLLKIFIFSLTAFSCSAANNINSGDYVIRYVNLKSVSDYVYNSSNEARELKTRIDSLNKKIDELEKSGISGSATELTQYKSEMIKAGEQEKKLKSEFYGRIKTAVSNVALKHNTDFILNSGDGVIYSRPVYDLTSEVIKELKSIGERTSPVYK